MKAILAVCLVTLSSLVAAQPAKPDKSCFEDRPKVRPSECCNGVSSMIDVTALGTCKAKYPDPEPESDQAAPPSDKPGRHGGRRGPRVNPCLIECYMNQTAMYKNGTLDKATAVTVLGKSLDESMKAVLSAAIDSCLAIHEQFKAKFSGGDRPKMGGGKQDINNKSPPMPQCDRAAGFIAHCVEMEMYKNCPADKMVTSDSCKSLATYMDKCKFDKKA